MTHDPNDPGKKTDPAADPAPVKEPEKDPAAEPAKEPPAAADPVADPATDPATDPAGDPAADPAPTKEPETDPAQEPAKDPEPAADPAPDTDGELTALRDELQAANAKLAAYRAGVPAEAVDDAVVLALHDLQAAGKEATGDSLREAIDAVIGRHPGWQQPQQPKAPAKAGAPAQDDTGTQTRTMPTGTVIF